MCRGEENRFFLHKSIVEHHGNMFPKPQNEIRKIKADIAGKLEMCFSRNDNFAISRQCISKNIQPIDLTCAQIFVNIFFTELSYWYNDIV